MRARTYMAAAVTTACGLLACTPVTPAPPPPAPPPTTTKPATVGDRVWVDTNKNGLQDKGEPGGPPTKVTLYRQTETTRERVAVKTTENGWYRFKETRQGQCYRVQVALPKGFTFAPPNAGKDETKDSDVTSSGWGPKTCGEAVWENHLDIGLIRTGTTQPPTTTPPTTRPPATLPPTTQPPTTQPPQGWKLTFADEFQGTKLDTSKWTPEHSTYGDGGGSIHCNTPDNLAVTGGALVIEGRKEAVRCPNNGGRDRDYSTGLVRTRGKFSQAYGRFEIRAKMPKGKGLWTGLWLLSENYPFGHNGQSGEIDIVETLGNQVDDANTTVHWNYNGCGWGCSKLGKVSKLSGGDISAWHTYALEWNPGSIAWEIDGQQVYKVGEGGSYKWGDQGPKAFNWPTDGGTQSRYPRPFTADNPMNIILNLAIGGTWPGHPDSTTAFPAQMKIDYVRVYKRS